MAVLGAWLRQVGGAAFDMRQRGQRRIPRGGRVESAASFVRLPPARGVEDVARTDEERTYGRRDRVLIEIDHAVVAGIALRTHEPDRRIDRQPLRGQQASHLWAVGHLREGACVRSAAPASARPAVMCRLMRVVEADRAVADDEHERRHAAGNAGIFEQPPDDRRHLGRRVAGVLSDRWRTVVALHPEPGA